MSLNKCLKQIFLLLILVASFGTTHSFAQTKTKAKAKIYKSKTPTAKAGEYYNGHKIITGPRGCKYYINKNGNKTYRIK